jgi:SPP1 family phage portal protein
MLYSKNRKSFIDICQGSFGRKIIYSSAKEITEANIEMELGKALSIHWQNREEIDYLDRYYRGDQPILYKEKRVRPEINNKIVENHALEIVRFMASQNFGEPIQYVSREKDKSVSDMIDKLNKYMLYRDKSFHDVQIGEWQSICGTAYRFTWNDANADTKMGEPPFDFEIPDPKFCFVVYSTEKGKPKLFSVQQIKDEDNKDKYCIYTKNRYFEIQNSKIIDNQSHALGYIPITEYPNNSRRISDLEIVIAMLDAINNMQSNRMNGIEQFIQAFMKFVNCEIDETQFKAMAELGAFLIKGGQPGVQSDVDLVAKELDQQQSQISKDDLYKNMLIIEGMPDRQQNTGGDTGQAVYLRNGWDFAEQRAKLDEPVIARSEKDFLKLILHIVNTKQSKTGINLKLSDIDIKITRNKTDNMIVKTQGLTNQLTAGIHPKIAIETCGLYPDPEKVYLQSKDYLDAKYLTKAEMDKQVEQAVPPKGGD